MQLTQIGTLALEEPEEASVFFSSRRRHTRSLCEWSSDVCSSDLIGRASGWKRGEDWMGDECVKKNRRGLFGSDRKRDVEGESVDLGVRRMSKREVHKQRDRIAEV